VLKKINVEEFGVSDVLAKTWSVYCKQFKLITAMLLTLSLPGVMMNSIIVEQGGKLDPKNAVLLFAFILIGIVISSTVMLGVALVVEDTVKTDENRMNWKTVLRKAFSRLGSYIGTSLLASLILFGFSLLLVIPGIIWTLYYAFFMQVVVLRGIGGKAALNYSKSLVEGRWWKVFWILFVISLIYIAMSFGLGFVSFLLPEVIRMIFGVCIYAIVFGFYIVAPTILFLNLDYTSKKNRNEIIELDGRAEM